MHCMFNTLHLFVWEQELEVGGAALQSLVLLGREGKVKAAPS